MYVIIAQVDVVIILFQRNRVQVKFFPDFPLHNFFSKTVSINCNKQIRMIAQWIADKAEHPVTLANRRMGALVACILCSIAF